MEVQIFNIQKQSICSLLVAHVTIIMALWSCRFRGVMNARQPLWKNSMVTFKL